MTNTVASVLTAAADSAETTYNYMVPLVIGMISIGVVLSLVKRFVPSRPRG